MVSDINLTIDAVVELFEIQQFDKQCAIRHNEVSDSQTQDLTVSHDKTKTGINRTLARLDEHFVNSASFDEQASVYLVMTYKSGEGKTRCKALGRGLLDSLSANTYANLDSLASKGYMV